MRHAIARDIYCRMAPTAFRHVDDDHEMGSMLSDYARFAKDAADTLLGHLYD